MNLVTVVHDVTKIIDNNQTYYNLFSFESKLVTI